MKVQKLLVSIFFITVLIACKGKDDSAYTVFNGNAQGTTYSVKYISADGSIKKEQLDSIFIAIDASLSTYKSNSIISRINSNEDNVLVDDLFKNVYEASERVFYESDGLFDPTVAPLVNAYGFGPDGKINSLSSSEIDSLKSYIGINKTQITEKGIFKKVYQQSKLDFNAIAQGYSVDIIVDFLLKNNINNAIVEVGGETRAIGRNTFKNKRWIVGIDDPLQKSDSRFYTTAMLEDLSLATSGNYRKINKDTITGNYYVHTVNPITGLAKKTNILSVSVVTKKCMYADAYATVFMMMSLDQTKKFLLSNPTVQVLIIYQDKKGAIKEFKTPNFPKP